MAIQSSRDDSNPQDPKLKLTINNGDLEALTTVRERYKFVSDEALIRYALVAMLEAEDNRLRVKKGEETVTLKPNENLIQHDGDQA
jgi:hypothetical protein